jgi:peptidoglycan L-alanyl-D-glutamate endopeptidase CwlK
VQLTGRANYATYGQRLKLPLIDEPERANDAQAAAQLLAVFLQDRELRIKQAVLDHDLASARRLVNGGSHGLEAFTHAWRVGDLLTEDDA